MLYLQAGTGLLVLLFGGDLLVRGAISMAQRLSLSPLVIGLTVVAFGTSAPELVVCVDAVLSNLPSIAIGNVVGSNIANVLLVLGMPAMIYPIVYKPDVMRRDGSLMMAATALFVAFCWTAVIDRWQGAVLFVVLVGFLIFSYYKATREGDGAIEEYGDEYEGIEAIPHTLWLSSGFVVLGCLCLVFGAQWLIDGAVAVARTLGVSEAVIGLTLVAFGTSLPELATSLVAVVRQHGEVVMGNVLGSNMFNLLGIMGVTAMVAPVPVPAKIFDLDIWVMVAVTILLGAFAFRRMAIGRGLGVVLFLGYGAYIAVQFIGASPSGSGLG